MRTEFPDAAAPVPGQVKNLLPDSQPAKKVSVLQLRQRMALFHLTLLLLSSMHPLNAVPSPDVYNYENAYCEFMLVEPPFTAPAQRRLKAMVNTKPVHTPLVNMEATPHAFETFGLPRSPALRVRLARVGIHDRLVIYNAAGGKEVAHLTLDVPPIFVWKEVEADSAEATLDPGFETEEIGKLAFGVVYPAGDLRRFVSYSIHAAQGAIKLRIGLDVRCRDLRQYTSQLPLIIVINEEEAYCRVELLSTWMR